MPSSFKEPEFICKRSGFVDHECCEPCDCATTRRIVDQMGVHSYHGSEGLRTCSELHNDVRAQLPNDYLIIDYVPDGPYKPLEIAYGVLYPPGYKPPPPLTRWQRFKRRWLSRWDRVTDAWGVLRGTHFTVSEDDDGDY